MLATVKLSEEDTLFIDNVKKFTKKIEDEIILLISKSFQENYMLEYSEKLSKDIQEKIFRKPFLDRYIRNIEYNYLHVKCDPSKLIVNQCNLPAELTQRSKNNKKGMPIPCRNSVRTGHFFCYKHFSYARLYDLPINQQLAGLTVTQKIKNKKRNLEYNTANIDSSYNCKKKMQKQYDLIDTTEFPYFQCCFECPFTNVQCNEIGKHVDLDYPDLKYCENHVIVTENLLEFANYDSNSLKDLLELRRLDNYLNENELNLDICKKRIFIASKYGLGTSTKISDFIRKK